MLLNAEKLLKNISVNASRVIYVKDYMYFEEIHDFPLISVDVGIWDTVICGDDDV